MIALTQLASSCLAKAFYQEDLSTLQIHFHNGSVYNYSGLPRPIFDAFLAAPSKGSFFHRHIRHHSLATAPMKNYATSG